MYLLNTNSQEDTEVVAWWNSLNISLLAFMMCLVLTYLTIRTGDYVPDCDDDPRNNHTDIYNQH